jgi:hypothetical protein
MPASVNRYDRAEQAPEYDDDASRIVVSSLILTLTSSSASVPSLTVGDFLLVATVFLNVVKYLEKIVNVRLSTLIGGSLSAKDLAHTPRSSSHFLVGLPFFVLLSLSFLLALVAFE